MHYFLNVVATSKETQYPKTSYFQDHQSDCHSGPETEIDPLFIKKEEMDDYIKDVDENVIDDIKYDAPDYTHKDAHDDFDRDMDGDADLADENLKIYIDEALQVKQSRVPTFRTHSII